MKIFTTILLLFLAAEADAQFSENCIGGYDVDCETPIDIALGNVRSTNYSAAADMINQNTGQKVGDIAVAYQSADLPLGVAAIEVEVRVTSVGPTSDVTVIIDFYARLHSGERVFLESLTRKIKASRIQGGE